MSRPTTLRPLPLLYEGDSYLIYLKEVGTRCVKILTIHRFRHNQNTEGVEENFRDLDLDTKRAVVQQINRAHVGRTILT
jgi:hypothetical protein